MFSMPGQIWQMSTPNASQGELTLNAERVAVFL